MNSQQSTVNSMSKPTLVHIQESEFEIVLNVDSINYVGKMGTNVFIHFNGECDKLALRGSAGEAVWKLIRGSSVTIYQAPQDNKKRRNPYSKGFRRTT
ncbi:hypothetical protein [Nostoc piscinale]|nr:hypothetical protein [Nostoc piscinale]